MSYMQKRGWRVQNGIRPVSHTHRNATQNFGMPGGYYNRPINNIRHGRIQHPMRPRYHRNYYPAGRYYDRSHQGNLCLSFYILIFSSLVCSNRIDLHRCKTDLILTSDSRIGSSFKDNAEAALSVAGASFAGGLLAGPFGMAFGGALGGLAQYARHRYLRTKLVELFLISLNLEQSVSY